MTTVLLRDRYLTALGLSGLVFSACSANEGVPTPVATTVATETTMVVPTATAAEPPTVVATSTATVAVGTATPSATPVVPSWTPTVARKPPPTSNTRPTPPTFNMPSCPSGMFCVAEANAGGTEMSPAPFGKCAVTVKDPEDKDGMHQYIRLDPEQTKLERTAKKDACCYGWSIPCPGGRPLMVDGRARIAEESASVDWLPRASSWEDLGRRLPALAPSTRLALSDHYAREASFEHASIASFARVSLSLLAVGAPPELVADTHRAALDEIAHAEAMYCLASAYRDAPIGPSAIDLSGMAPASSTVSEIAKEAFFEGCIGEVAAALVLREEAERAGDVTTRRTLTKMAEDEERHAELAWRTVAWALSRHPSEVRDVLELARFTCAAELASVLPDERFSATDRKLVTSARERAVIRKRAIAEVVAPCLDALLARDLA